MTWNYRIMRTLCPDGTPSYGIHEVYYGQDGEVRNWTANDVGPHGETLEELASDLAHVFDALRKPVLDQKTGAEVQDVNILADLLAKVPELSGVSRS
jgi:hypothetical protein